MADSPSLDLEKLKDEAESARWTDDTREEAVDERCTLFVVLAAQLMIMALGLNGDDQAARYMTLPHK